MKLHKNAQFWKGFLRGVLLGLAPLLTWLEYSHGDISNLISRLQSNPQIVAQEVIEEGKSKDAPYFVIKQVEQNLASLPENIQESESQNAPEEQTGFDYDSFRTRLERNEGNRNRAFRIGNKGEIDIGMGHVMNHPRNGQSRSRRIFNQLFGDSVNFDEVLRGRATLTQEQLNALNNYEIDEHLASARRRFPRFDTYPQEAQFAILDAIYRGDMGPVTTRLINAGNYSSAVDEYINHDDYRRAERGILPGVKTRMDANQEGLRSLLSVEN